MCYKYLRSTCIQPSRRSAFSLAELVVAVGILVLMMSMAGQVFNFTVQSTGQAIALTQINRNLRILEQLLRDDLRTVQPGRSMILIQGNPINAYWTQDGMDADSNSNPLDGYAHINDPERERDDRVLVSPRADLLMIFTARRSSSFVDPDVTSNMQQVVYGHAELGEYVPNGGGPGAPPFVFHPGPVAFPFDQSTGYPDPLQPSPVPAQSWHLARRNILLLPTAPPASGISWNFLELSNGLADGQLLQGEVDIVGDFPYEQLVQAPWWPRDQWYLPRVFKNVNLSYLVWDKPFARSQLDVTPPALMANRLGHYLIPHCASFKVEWTLDPHSEFVAGRLDAMKETYWFDPGVVLANNGKPDVTQDDPLIDIQNEIDVLAATNDPVLINKRDRLQYLLFNKNTHTNNSRYALINRFQSDQMIQMNKDPNLDWKPLAPDRRANLVAFLANVPHVSNSEDVPDDLFPGALRITVDVFDREGRLERPIRHVMVIPVGR